MHGRSLSSSGVFSDFVIPSSRYTPSGGAEWLQVGMLGQSPPHWAPSLGPTGQEQPWLQTLPWPRRGGMGCSEGWSWGGPRELYQAWDPAFSCQPCSETGTERHSWVQTRPPNSGRDCEGSASPQLRGLAQRRSLSGNDSSSEQRLGFLPQNGTGGCPGQRLIWGPTAQLSTSGMIWVLHMAVPEF